MQVCSALMNPKPPIAPVKERKGCAVRTTLARERSNSMVEFPALSDVPVLASLPLNIPVQSPARRSRSGSLPNIFACAAESNYTQKGCATTCMTSNGPPNRVNHYKFVGGGQFRGGQAKEVTCKCEVQKQEFKAKEQWFREQLQQRDTALSQIENSRAHDLSNFEAELSVAQDKSAQYLSRCNELSAESELLRTTMQEMENKYSDAKASAKTSRAAVAREAALKCDAISETSEVSRELKEVEQKLQSAELRCTADREVSAARVCTLEEELRGAQERICALEVQLVLSATKFSELEQQRQADQEEHGRKIKVLQDVYHQADRDAKGVLQECKANLTALTEHRNHLSCQVVTLEAKVYCTEQAIEKVKASRDALEDLVQTKDVELADQAAQVSALEVQLLAASSRAVAAETQLSKTKEELSKVQDSCKQEMEQVRALARAQVHVVVSAPCVRLNINDRKHAFRASSCDVTSKVSAVLSEQLLPNYLAVFTACDKVLGEKQADEHAQAFITDMSKEINEKIVPMLYKDLGDNMELVDRSSGSLLGRRKENNIPKTPKK